MLRPHTQTHQFHVTKRGRKNSLPCLKKCKLWQLKPVWQNIYLNVLSSPPAMVILLNPQRDISSLLNFPLNVTNNCWHSPSTRCQTFFNHSDYLTSLSIRCNYDISTVLSLTTGDLQHRDLQPAEVTQLITELLEATVAGGLQVLITLPYLPRVGVISMGLHLDCAVLRI